MEKFSGWSRNVIDEFKDLSEDQIKQKLQERSLPFSVLLQHVNGDFNIGTAIRNANNFGAKEIFYFGKKKFDKRGAMGVYNYSPVYFIEKREQLADLKQRYYFVGLENISKSVSIVDYKWKPNSLMIFGEENSGLTDGILELCEDIVSIPSFGSVRSLNCGTASGIAMYDFVVKNKR